MLALVTMDQWGKDHWSTFAYAETCTVDHDGFLDMRRMRMDGEKYPTRLKGEELVGHNDLDCLRDAALLGLLEMGRATQRNADYSIKALTYQVSLTSRGQKVEAALRAHKANGGSFASFSWVLDS